MAKKTSQASLEGNKRLVSQIKRYMKENDIPRVEIKKKETLVLEPIPHGERAMWVQEWLNGNFTTKQLLKQIRNFMKYHFQWCQWSTRDFLRAVKESRGFNIG